MERTSSGIGFDRKLAHRVRLPYGEEGLWVELPDANTSVVEPRFVEGLHDEEAAICEALRHPIAMPPLRDLATPRNRVAIVFSDFTRPMPSDRVLPILLEEIGDLPKENILLINALGPHRRNTREELTRMLGQEVVEKHRIVQHDCRDYENLVHLGETSHGHAAWVNKDYIEADVKILTGLIEPHFFAGFSGGPKAILPGIAGEKTILGNHGTKMIAHPKATWGVTLGNPIWEEAKEVAERAGCTFLLNVSVNKRGKITGVFAGDMWQAHARGSASVKSSAMVPVRHPFDIVITTNLGYPLDLNLYQAVKGMSAAAQVVKPGGSIIAAAEGRGGIPDHGKYRELLHMAKSPQELLEIINAPGFSKQDQWAAQIQALIQLKAEVYLKTSYLSDEEVCQRFSSPVTVSRRRWSDF